jgi:hypothetical protein
MSKRNRNPSEKENLVTSLKIGVFMTVLGWVILAIEAPQLTAVPEATATSASVAHPASTGTAPAAADYFPAQFPAPQGEPEPAPATF